MASWVARLIAGWRTPAPGPAPTAAPPVAPPPSASPAAASIAPDPAAAPVLLDVVQAHEPPATAPDASALSEPDSRLAPAPASAFAPAPTPGLDTPAAAVATAETAEPAAPPPAPVVPVMPVTPANTVAWLISLPPGEPRSQPNADELVALAHVRTLLSPDRPAADLLPRAGAVIPQLMALMRQEDLSLRTMAEQVAKDRVLAAEVLRVASSATYRSGGEPRDLDDAIARIGTVGLRSAIARVVLKPILRGEAGALSAQAEAGLWALGERQAQALADLCGAQGLDRFEGYMAGLVHSTGWTVALRALDRAGWRPRLAPSIAFAEPLIAAKDALFGKVVGSWALAPAIDALCAQAARGGLAGSDAPFAVLLRQSEQAAMAAMLNPDPPA